MKTLKNFWSDIIEDTPKIYQWFCGILISISASAGIISYTFDRLPQNIQAVVPATLLQTVAGLTFIGAVLAKKKNVKIPPASNITEDQTQS